MARPAPKELSLLRRLSTPIKIQDFLDTLPINYEKNGETYMSPAETLKAQKAHCFEGALLAAAALSLHGERPLLLDLKTTNEDVDHVVALYTRNGYWGAISKTNHTSLRFRDPIYKTIRELALSYFHEYFENARGRKTMISYSAPFDLDAASKLINGENWMTTAQNLYPLVLAIDKSAHFPIVPKKNRKLIRPADRMERKAGTLTEWKKSNRRT